MSRSRRNEKEKARQALVPGYAIDCVPDLKRFAKKVADSGDMPKTMAAIEDIIEAIDIGAHFAMPSGGKIFDGGIDSKMLPAFHAPCPRMTIEYDSPPQACVPGDPYHETPVPARIAVVVEDDAERGATIWPVNLIRGVWVPNWCGAYIPYEQEPGTLTAEEREAEKRRMEKAGFVDSGGKLPRLLNFTMLQRAVPLGEFGFLCAERMVARGVDPELAMAADTMHEITATVQLCAALNCTNVRTEQIVRRDRRPPRPGQQRTDYTYHVLVVGGERAERGDGLGGHHASPRTHLRRGHIRHLPWSGDHIWINSCIVGASNPGGVHKSYAVR